MGQNNPNPDSSDGPKRSRLENLPAEIRRHILGISELPTLKALVHASPTFHQQYLDDRDAILSNSLINTLGSVATDAHFVNHFEVHAHLRKFSISHVLDMYSEALSRQPTTSGNILDAAKEMARFYLKSVKDVLEKYTLRTLDKLVDVSKAETCNRQVSRMETLRFTRAIYRFQLFCQIITKSRNDHLVKNLDRFIIILEPWEAEELFSFYHYVEDTYRDILGSIAQDVSPDNPKFQDQDTPNTPDGAFWLEIDCMLICTITFLACFSANFGDRRAGDAHRRHLAKRSLSTSPRFVPLP